MMNHRTLAMIMAVAALGVTTPLFAQSRSAVSSAELDAAVTAHPTGTREAVQQFLATDQVLKVAGRMGVNPSELSARVATLDQGSLDQIAAQTEVGDRVLAGGTDTIIVSTTAVIIFLLLLILLVK